MDKLTATTAPANIATETVGILPSIEVIQTWSTTTQVGLVIAVILGVALLYTIAKGAYRRFWG